MDIKSVKKVNYIGKDILGCYALTDIKDNIHFVPLDEDNTDYQAILAWVAKGNTIEEAD
tara:strand:+ start:1174 stop:1350 length:177 start_codon:yes stop_codon:yes gene_type:complete